MIIQKMNNVLVKHGKVTFAIFTGVVIVSFVWFFTPGVDGSLLFGGNIGMNSRYGTVLGHDVTYGDVANARQIVSMIRGATSGLSPQQVQSLDEDASFRVALQLKAADVLNIQASDKEVSEAIHSLPVFQQDGKFSGELYTNYKNIHLAPSGLGFSDLEEAIRSMIRMDKVMMLTASSVVVPDSEAETLIQSMLQKITYHIVSFDPDAFEDQVKLEDAEIKDFYTANPDLFMSEPESDGLLAYVPYTEKKNEVSEEQVKDYYELRKGIFIKEDGSEQTFDEVKDEIRKELETTVDREDAIAKARAFHNAYRAAIKADKLDGNEIDPQVRFREEAEKAGLKVSEVKNITAQTKDDAELHIDHTLIDAVSILKNVGSDTNVLTGADGASKFLLTARRPSVLQPFEDVKEKAQKYLTNQRERALADEAASQLSLKVLDLKDPAAEMEDLVKSLKGVWHPENTQSRFEVESESSNPYLPLPCANEILTTDVGKLSSPDKQFGYPMFVFVNAHTPATAEEIAEKKDYLELVLKARKQEIVSHGIQTWIFSSATTTRRGQNQE
jgi:hypothetical protein